MVQIDPKATKYIVWFKKKDERPNQVDDKFELFRHAIGLADVSDILNLLDYTGHHANTPIHQTNETVTDINSYYNAYIIARLTKEQVIRLRKDPNVLMVESDWTDRPIVENPGYQVFSHRAGTAWSNPLGIRGTGVVVGVIDTGGYPDHVDLRANMAGSQNFSAGYTIIAPDEGSEHGTHCQGIIGAVQGNNIGMTGIAPSCKLWNYACAIDCEINGQQHICISGAGQIQSLEHAKANGVHVINMSFGGPNEVSTRAASIRDGYDRLNMLFVGGSGNDGTSGVLFYPSASYGVIGVGAIDDQDEIAGFSNRGSYVDLVGCGVSVFSTANQDLYRALSGTSMAGPCVSGVCALAVSAYKTNNTCPPYTPGVKKNDLIVSIMQQTAQQLSGAAGTRNNTFGFGKPLCDRVVSVLQQK